MGSEGLLFRIGLEIETCFSSKRSRIYNGAKETCYLIGLESGGGEFPVEFLDTTKDDKSLFKGKPEVTSSCSEGSGACNVELIINSKREIYFNGSELVEQDTDGWKSIMQEFNDSISEWKEKGIISCSAYRGRPIVLPDFPSSCSVHLHISAPFMEDIETESFKKLYKIFVYYLWYIGEPYSELPFQDILSGDSGNPNWVFGKDESPYKTKEELDFKLPTHEEIINMINNIFNKDADKTLLELLDDYYSHLPIPEGTSERLIDKKDTLSNILIVDELFNNNYPHFEFRGHYDIVLSGDLNTLIQYIKAIYDILSMAYFILKNKGIKAGGGKKRKYRKTNRRSKLNSKRLSKRRSKRSSKRRSKRRSKRL